MKTCKCGCQYEGKEDLCPECYAKSLGDFWISAKNWRVSMHSDGNMFVAKIQAGIDGDNYLAVGYSEPNYAWITKEMIPLLDVELNKFYATVEELDLDDMLPTLYELCKIANRVYNNLIMRNK